MISFNEFMKNPKDYLHKISKYLGLEKVDLLIEECVSEFLDQSLHRQKSTGYKREFDKKENNFIWKFYDQLCEISKNSIVGLSKIEKMKEDFLWVEKVRHYNHAIKELPSLTKKLLSRN